MKETMRPRKVEYNRENREKINEHREKMMDGVKVCKICGNPIMDKSPTVTCSEECAKELKRRMQKSSDDKRRKRKREEHQKKED